MSEQTFKPIYVPAKLHKKIKAAANRQGRTLKGFCERWLPELLDDSKKPLVNKNGEKR